MDQHTHAEFDDAIDVTEAIRLDILSELAILDTPPESEFDTLVALARQITGCKIALISLVDRDRQWFKAKSGLAVQETARDLAFCAHAIRQTDVMVIPDARQDPRFENNALVTGAPGVVFYAGAPIRVRTDAISNADKVAIGTLCVIDDQPRQLDDRQHMALENLARLAEVLLERRAAVFKAEVLANDRKLHLRQMDLRNRHFRQAERMANIGSWRLDLATNRTEWSEQVFAIHGLPVGEYPSLNNALDFYPGEARTIITKALAGTVETGQPFSVETDFVTAHGEYRRVRSMGEIELQDARPIAVIGVFQDVTQQYALENRLRRSAQEDDLTGLANRAHFNEYISCAIAKAKRYATPLVVLLIDLDGFKAVNDRCGHRAGDGVLQQFAAKLRAPYLRDCFVARLGGDEFVIVVDDPATCDALETLLKRLLADLHTTVAHPDGTVFVSATIGASHWTAATPDSSELLHRADMALYQAKQRARGTAKIDGRSAAIRESRSIGERRALRS